jgi:hypothetical protein
MPRWVYVALAWLFAAISVCLAARYGYKGADTVTDGVISAVTFGAIAAAGGALQALAVHVGVHVRHRFLAIFWGIVIGLVGASAMVATVSNSLGAIAGRGDQTLAERLKASDATKDDRAELARLATERGKLPTFRPIGAVRADMEAAQAGRAYKISGGCQPEQVTTKGTRESCDAYRKLEGEMATAEAGERLDKEIATVRARLDKAPAVRSTDPQAATIARLFGVTQDDAAAWHYLFLAIVLELCVAGSMIGVELTKGAPAAAAESVIDKHTEGTPAEPTVVPINKARPIGDVAKFAVTCLRPTAGASVAIPDLYPHYQAWSDQQNFRAVSAGKFDEQFAGLCDLSGFKRLGKKCLGLQLAA